MIILINYLYVPQNSKHLFYALIMKVYRLVSKSISYNIKTNAFIFIFFPGAGSKMRPRETGSPTR